MVTHAVHIHARTKRRGERERKRYKQQTERIVQACYDCSSRAYMAYVCVYGQVSASLGYIRTAHTVIRRRGLDLLAATFAATTTATSAATRSQSE